LSDPVFSPEAGLALSFMGSPAVAPLKDALASDEPVVRREALRALGKLRERASIDPLIVVPLLLESLKDPDPAVRQVATTYLGIVRDRPPEEVAGLIEALSDSEAAVRHAAALALSSYGLDAEPAVKALTKASTSDPDDDVKQEAARALVHINELKGKTAA
jgi:HEAT repeat protein